MFPLEPWEQVVCTLPMMTRHDLPPKKERWLSAFLNSTSSPLLFLRYIFYCIALATLAGLLPYPAMLFACDLDSRFVAVILDRRKSRYPGHREADEKTLLSCGQNSCRLCAGSSLPTQEKKAHIGHLKLEA
jgi:hypothetical protein